MLSDCTICGKSEVTAADVACGECAQAGSEWTGLWQAGVSLNDAPATTRSTTQAALTQLGWAGVTVEPLDPEAGVWLLTLPARAMRRLQTHGYVCESAGQARVEVELP